MKQQPPCRCDRTFFNLFRVFDCKDCPLLRFDETHRIGEIAVNIYYADDGCLLTKKASFLVRKTACFLKDAVFNSKDNIIVWLDRFSMEDDDMLFDLLAFEQDVHILID